MKEERDMNAEQSSFEGWAIVDVLGHQRYAGYVTTKYFGNVVLFRVESPAREARMRKLPPNDYIGNGYGYTPDPDAGWQVSEGAVAGSERFIGAASIYGLTPSSQADALRVLDEIAPRPFLGVVDANGAPIAKPQSEEMPW